MYKILPILLFACGLALTTDEIYDDSWAVIIGINEYEHVDQLNYAVQDAEAIKNLLISNFNFSKEHIIMLTDKEATLDNIRTKLFEVATSVNEGDRLLVYYAGHGETYNLKSGSERGYLIPVDGDLDNIFATCLPMSDIKEVASVTEAKHVLFLMDACYGGLLAVDARSISKTTSGYIDKITRDNARQIITAGGKGEQVIEKSEWGHSAFAKNLLHGLKTGIADEDSDGYITADELGSFLKKRVTIDSDNFQTPVKRRFGSDEGEFVFINNMYIEDQAINILSKNENNVTDVDELREEIAQLKEELNKPVKFIQGCTDDRAENYKPDANLDDNSCIILKGGDAYIRFGDFNSSDSTLDVYITAHRQIYDLEFQTQGFKIETVLDGILSNYGFLITSEDAEQGAWYFALSIMGYNPMENYRSDFSSLLFKAKVLPNDHIFCIEEIKNEDFNNLFIGECITVDFHRKTKYNNDNSEWSKPGIIGYTSDTPFAGFQFDVEGVSLIDVAGGDAGDAGFMFSTSTTRVLGFSLKGDIIPAGDGVLVVLDVEGNIEDRCISDVIIADSAGRNLNYTIEDCHIIHVHSSIIYGCTDMYACNYNVHASENDGSCIYETAYFYLDVDGDGLGSGDAFELCKGLDLTGWVSNNEDRDDKCYSNIHDCANVCDGQAFIDDCANCVAGTTDLEPCSK